MKKSKPVFFNGEYIGNCIVENGAVFNFNNEYIGFVSETGYLIDSKLKPICYVGRLRE